MIEAKRSFFKEANIQLLWQCGKLYAADYEKYANDDIAVRPFINEMDKAFAAADIIISRAGASSVSELCLVGKPVVFIPSPNVAEDHQTKNAQALVEKNAAILLRESDLDTQFEKVFKELMQSKALQQQLSEEIKKLGLPKATAHIVDEIEKLIQ